jgi:hypothetical protein
MLAPGERPSGGKAQRGQRPSPDTTRERRRDLRPTSTSQARWRLFHRAGVRVDEASYRALVDRVEAELSAVELQSIR